VTLTSDLYMSNLLPSVARVQGCISTKFEVSMAFPFRVNRRHQTDGRTDGHTDRVQLLMWPHGKGRVILHD